MHVAARPVASCSATCCTLQRRLLQVVARIVAGCWLSGCRLQYRALQVATRRVARCNTACCSAQHRVCCAQLDATPHGAFLSRHHHVLQARCSTPPPSRTPPFVQRRGCYLQRRRRRPLRVRLPIPRSGRGRCMDAHAAVGPPRRTAVLAAPGRCTRVWSSHRCAVGRFSVGTYTFTCATDCGFFSCQISEPGSKTGGTLPDVFHRLTCASKITLMCAPSARAAPRPVPISVLARRRAPSRARVCCVHAGTARTVHTGV